MYKSFYLMPSWMIVVGGLTVQIFFTSQLFGVVVQFDGTHRYAQYGEVSAKVDVYAFGVVLYELISAKEAVVRDGSVADTKGLVGLVTYFFLC